MAPRVAMNGFGRVGDLATLIAEKACRIFVAEAKRLRPSKRLDQFEPFERLERS